MISVSQQPFPTGSFNSTVLFYRRVGRLPALAQTLSLETLCALVFWFGLNKEILRHHCCHVSGLQHSLCPQSPSSVWAATNAVHREWEEGPGPQPSQTSDLLLTWWWKYWQDFPCWLQWIFLSDPQIPRILQDHCQSRVKMFPKKDRKHWNKLLEATAFISLTVFQDYVCLGGKNWKPMNLIYLKLFSYFTWNVDTYP